MGVKNKTTPARPTAMAGRVFRLGGRVGLVAGGGPGGGGGGGPRARAAAGGGGAVRARGAAAARRVAAELGGLAVVGDVTSEADVDRVCGEAEAGLGPVDLLVNNAGVTGKAGRVWELTRADLESVLSVNVVGPWLLCRRLLPGMMARRFGRVVNVASIAGKEGNP